MHILLSDKEVGAQIPNFTSLTVMESDRLQTHMQMKSETLEKTLIDIFDTEKDGEFLRIKKSHLHSCQNNVFCCKNMTSFSKTSIIVNTD